ncbi:Indolepyruvate ferredoxin oxidoreductase, alpha and beta subunits [Dehalogenimonas alkenigignens]|uniref:Indolepyruvate oxidoreductase subunit IorA n=1 Tax=Dehalogenimonas alkenigignens TaxID=1217799 RepID=A0A0W0GHW5_9CHLR|nr:thiamine pyrophosphate-dependent enzyme [Dehalogenimonas alkenigignens]KTB48150.1 Indolepyruvate ferredoxin oxidoreductase, alpha and beta subunits [Dehalogenimonas alkenigignens]
MERLLLSGNEAIALGACHAGLKLAAAYPGTPSTEILEAIAKFPGIYSEWSSNEAVAVEVALGASYTGVRAMACMKHVGLNVAADAFMAASTTGVRGGLLIVAADDPGIHSSQNEQDSRNYARLGKVPCLEPSDSQEAYDFARTAFQLSEEFDTPVLLRPTTRVCHSKSVVIPSPKLEPARTPEFRHEPGKLVMLPGAARERWHKVLERWEKLAAYTETSALNRVVEGSAELGIVASGIGYQYAREVFPNASFLKLGMTHPLPGRLLRDFAGRVKTLLVIEELEDFIEQSLRSQGIAALGKEIFPRTGEFSPDIIRDSAVKAGIISNAPAKSLPAAGLARRPPLLCPGCPHSGVFFTLSSLGHRSTLPGKKPRTPKMTICGDIGCYTLGAYQPLGVIDTCGCMGAGISQAAGMAKAGAAEKPLAVIGDSTFMHSGINSLLNAVYNQAKICVLILDNGTTAMTGHQGHPGSGVAATGQPAPRVIIEELVRGAGVRNASVVDAFDLKAVRAELRRAMASSELEVIIVRGDCPTLTRKRGRPRVISTEKCDDCGACLLIGCSAIKKSESGGIIVDPGVCVGEYCTLCQQICPKEAISESIGVAA